MSRVGRLEGCALEQVISFVVEPHCMSVLCAACRRWDEGCWRRSAWEGTIVDTPLRAKPCGKRAHSHDLLWEFAEGVAVQEWMFASCSFLMHSKYKPWKWTVPSPPRPRVSIFPSRVASQLALAEGLWRHHRYYWVIVGSPVPCNMKLMIAPGGDGPVPDNFVVGIVDTNDAREIVSLLVDSEKRGVVERGPPPRESVRLNFYSVVAQRGSAAFQWNARKLPEIASSKGNPCPRGAVLTFGVMEEKMLLRS